MRKILIGAIGMLAVLLLIRFCARERADANELEESSDLIRQQIENVAKLIVTEGHFAEVYNYRDARQLFGPLISAENRALVVVNADVTIAYDLRKIQYLVDEEARTVRIQYIPVPEVKINPDFEYYDVQADFLNPFEAGDYNTIKERVNESLLKKIRASSLISNARNRLLSELSKLILLTNTLEWTLEYEDQPVSSLKDLNLPD
jgi:hypothetical protein